MPLPLAPAELLSRYADKIVDTDSGCRVFTGGLTKAGYAPVSNNYRRDYLHRVVYEAANGTIPEGMEIDHTCVNPACCKLAHLELVTHAENMRRIAARRTHCRRGHELTPENTYIIRRKGKEQKDCMTCREARPKKNYALLAKIERENQR